MMDEAEVDAAIARLEMEMEDLPRRHRELFSYANAWAVRHDAIIAATPGKLLPSVQRRLHRVGVRWGVASGVRVTAAFPALKIPA